MVVWNLRRLMKGRGCSTVKELQREIMLDRRSDTWLERLLLQSATLGIYFDSRLDKADPLSIRTITYDLRARLSGERRDLVSSRRLVARAERRQTDNQLRQFQKTIGDTNLALLQLHERGVLSVPQIISAPDGTIMSRT
eukprot:1396860-Rhodomonas_salina.1